MFLTDRDHICSIVFSGATLPIYCAALGPEVAPFGGTENSPMHIEFCTHNNGNNKPRTVITTCMQPPSTQYPVPIAPYHPPSPASRAKRETTPWCVFVFHVLSMYVAIFLSLAKLFQPPCGCAGMG